MHLSLPSPDVLRQHAAKLYADAVQHDKTAGSLEEFIAGRYNDIPDADPVSPELVECWLQGSIRPDGNEQSILMDALDLDMKVNTVQRKTHPSHKIYRQISSDSVGSTKKGKPSTSDGLLEAIDPEPVTKAPVYEYVADFRKMKGWTLAQIASATGCGIALIQRYESGAALPNKNTLRKFKDALHFMSADEYNEFESLVILQRLATIQKLQDDPSPYSKNAIGQELKELPKSYWQSAITRMFIAHGTAQTEPSAAWSDHIIPITHQSEYLRAMHHYLELHDVNITLETDLTPPTIRGLENGTLSTASPSCRRLIQFYADQQAKQMVADHTGLNGQNDFHFFDPTAFGESGWLQPTDWTRIIAYQHARRQSLGSDSTTMHH